MRKFGESRLIVSKDVSFQARCLYLYLCEVGNPAPSQKQLSKQTNIGVTSVAHRIKELIDAQWLTRKRVAIQGQRRTVYQFLL